MAETEAARAGSGASAERWRAHAALSVVQVCFALFPIFGKRAFEPGGFTPLSVGAWRILFGAGSLSLLAALGFRERLVPGLGDLARLALGALLGVVVNMTLYLEGLELSTASNAGLVMCLIPVFTFVIAAL